MIKSRYFYINSASRADGTDSKFTYSIPLGDSNEWTNVVLLSASIPKSYYLVQTNYNTFILREPGHTDTTITVPAGNYSRSSFMNVLPTLLNAASPSHWTYTMSYPDVSSAANTGKFTYTVS